MPDLPLGLTATVGKSDHFLRSERVLRAAQAGVAWRTEQTVAKPLPPRCVKPSPTCQPRDPVPARSQGVLRRIPNGRQDPSRQIRSLAASGRAASKAERAHDLGCAGRADISSAAGARSWPARTLPCWTRGSAARGPRQSALDGMGAKQRTFLADLPGGPPRRTFHT